MNILAHPKPMRRHTRHVEPVQCKAVIRLPGGQPNPGLHLELTFADGSTQRIIFEAGESLATLKSAVAFAIQGAS